MKRYNFVLVLLTLAVLFWLILNEDYSLSNIGLGFLLALITLFITQVFVTDSEIPDIKLSLVFALFVYFLKVFLNVFRSVFTVAKAVLKRNSNVDRVHITLPTEYPFINALICNTITLTPGTITLEFKGQEAEVMVLNPDHLPLAELQRSIEASYERLRDV